MSIRITANVPFKDFLKQLKKHHFCKNRKQNYVLASPRFKNTMLRSALYNCPRLRSHLKSPVEDFFVFISEFNDLVVGWLASERLRRPPSARRRCFLYASFRLWAGPLTLSLYSLADIFFCLFFFLSVLFHSYDDVLSFFLALLLYLTLCIF